MVGPKKPKQPRVKAKPLKWCGSAQKDILDFSEEARKESGKQLRQVQFGLQPDNSKPFNDVGAGTTEIIVDVADGWYRVMYVTKFHEVVYVLHCFKKKTNTTSEQDKKIAKARYKALLKER